MAWRGAAPASGGARRGEEPHSHSTNASGAALRTQYFDAWGKRLAGSIPATDRSVTGQELDDTGLLFYNARYYDPGIGRFVSADSIVPGNASGGMDGIAYKPLTVDFHEPGFVSAVNRENQLGPWYTLADDERQQLGSPWGPQNPQALNRYSYVQNNPLKWTDPTGHCPGCAVGAILAGAGITLSAPAIVAIAAVLTVSALIIFLSDANNRSWLMDQVRNGVENINAFVENLSEKVESFVENATPNKQRHPPAARHRYNTKKGAYEDAKRAGNGNEPVNHPDGPHGPHYHPGNGKGKPLNHDHYYYPKHRR